MNAGTQWVSVRALPAWYAMLAALGVLLLVACGGEEPAPAPSPTVEPTATLAPAPTPALRVAPRPRLPALYMRRRASAN